MMVAAVRDAPGTGTGAGAGMEQLKQVKSFPAGLRVLVVDDDPTCLKILDRMLKKCEYEVTTCTRGNDALTLLRGKRNSFDLVISDVYMPDLDGFELLERVGLEMDLPVIMMSADGGTNTVMKGIKHGACDYLIKPVRLEELQNIWQHVIRKKRTSSKDFEHSVGSFEENDKNKRGSDDLDYTSSANEGGDANWKMGKKRKENKEEEDDGEQDPDDPSASKKPRVVWSVELHQQFVNAVNQLGIDKAVPKRILELMHVQGLTRENVASHLQKYRLYLKRLSGVTQQQNGMGSSFGGPDHMGPMGLLGRYDMTGYGPSGQISPQTLAGIPAELIGRVNTANSLGIANVDRSLLLQASLQDSSSNLNRRFPPLMNSQGNLLQGFPNLETKQFPSVQQQHNPSFVNDAANPGFCVPPQLNMTTAAGGMDQSRLLNSNEAINPQKDALLMQFMHQRQQRQQPCQQQQQLPASVIQQASFGQLKSSQLQNGQMNFSSAGLAGMTAVPNDSRARNSLLPSSNGRGSLNNNITLISSTEDLNHSSANLNVNSTELSVSGGVAGISSTDYKSRSIPLVNATEYAVSSASGVSAYPAASVDMESAIAIQGMKKMGSANELLTSSSMGSSGLAFGRPNSIDQVSSENSRQNWQLQNTPATPDSGQAAAFLSPRGAQNLNAASMQDAAYIRNYGLVQKGSGFPSRFTQNAVPRMFNSVQNVNEQSDVDGRMRVKEEGVPDFILNGKNDPINFAEPYSDDLMSILLRQHPESFQEGDFQLDSL